MRTKTFFLFKGLWIKLFCPYQLTTTLVYSDNVTHPAWTTQLWLQWNWPQPILPSYWTAITSCMWMHNVHIMEVKPGPLRSTWIQEVTSSTTRIKPTRREPSTFPARTFSISSRQSACTILPTRASLWLRGFHSFRRDLSMRPSFSTVRTSVEWRLGTLKSWTVDGINFTWGMVLGEERTR